MKCKKGKKIKILSKKKGTHVCSNCPRPKVQLSKSKNTINPKVELRDLDPTQAPLVFNPHIKIV